MTMKKLKIFIVLAIIILAIILVILAVYKKEVEEDGPPVLVNGKVYEGQLLFSGISVFSEHYTGFMTRKEITDRISTMVTEEIPQMKEQFEKSDDNELTNYYNENKTTLIDNYGFENEEDFKAFVRHIVNSNTDFKKYDRVKVDTESFENDSDRKDYAYTEFVVKYLDGTQFDFTAYILRIRSSHPSFVIRIED